MFRIRICIGSIFRMRILKRKNKYLFMKKITHALFLKANKWTLEVTRVWKTYFWPFNQDCLHDIKYVLANVFKEKDPNPLTNPYLVWREKKNRSVSDRTYADSKNVRYCSQIATEIVKVWYRVNFFNETI